MLQNTRGIVPFFMILTSLGKGRGCVARNLRGMLEVCNLTFLFSLDSYAKQAGDECHLLHAVSFFYAMHLT